MTNVSDDEATPEKFIAVVIGEASRRVLLSSASTLSDASSFGIERRTWRGKWICGDRNGDWNGIDSGLSLRRVFLSSLWCRGMRCCVSPIRHPTFST